VHQPWLLIGPDNSLHWNSTYYALPVAASFTPRTCGVQHIPQGVEDEGEGTEEHDEGDDAGVEQSLCGEDVGQLQDHNRAWVAHSSSW